MSVAGSEKAARASTDTSVISCHPPRPCGATPANPRLPRMSQERGILMPLYTLNNQVNKLVRIRRLTPYLSRRVVRFKGDSPGARLLVE